MLGTEQSRPDEMRPSRVTALTFLIMTSDPALSF
jgi:hypothetical protein